jgi:hypothetical protein
MMETSRMRASIYQTLKCVYRRKGKIPMNFTSAALEAAK